MKTTHSIPALFLLASLVVAACDEAKPRESSAISVETALSRTADVALRTRTVGTVDPVQSATIRAQVGGYLREIGFAEGDEVEAGRVLFRIDTRGLDADVAQVRAALERARVMAANAEGNLKRAIELHKQNFISGEEFDRIRSESDSAREAVKVEEARARRTDVDRQFAVIRSPIAGRAGALAVHRGDLVRPGETVLVTIHQIRPIDVKFAVPERELAAVRAARAAGNVVVAARAGGTDGDPLRGDLVFIDNAVDAGTGSIALKARFENADERLWPGQFVDVEMTYGMLSGVVVVPARAVETGQSGSHVFVVDAERKAQLRPIRAGHADAGLVVVNEGLAAGEQVVTDGQSRLGPGTSVEIRNAPAAASGDPEGGEKNSVAGDAP